MQIALDISENDFEWIKKWAKDGTNIPVYDTLAKYIANAKVLPKENEHKTGKWEVYVNGFGNLLKCSCCTGFINITDECHIPYYAKNFLYCPYCGARMEKD